MSYTKRLIKATIHLVDGTVIIAQDTIDCPVASEALTALQNHGYANISTETGDYVVFSSGVAYAKVESSQSEEIPTPSPC